MRVVVVSIVVMAAVGVMIIAMRMVCCIVDMKINNDGFTGFGLNYRITDFRGHDHFSVNLGGLGDHGKCVEPVISLTPTDLLYFFVLLCFEFTTGEIFFWVDLPRQ